LLGLLSGLPKTSLQSLRLPRHFYFFNIVFNKTIFTVLVEV
jgi:hypothetical protein